MLSRIIQYFLISFIITNSLLANLCYSRALHPTELLEILNDLKVAPDCNDIPYLRTTWKHWIDADKDGHNTREEVLIFGSLISVILSQNGAKVLKGRWYDPYSDAIFSNPLDLDIDHFVPLGEAHKSGGCHWSVTKKKRYANTLRYREELIAVHKKANIAKGQNDPAKWLPPNKDYHCDYVSNWIVIKDRWNLWIDEQEKMAIEKIIKTRCIPIKVSKLGKK